ncbi:MAG TPA: NAD(P)/FAD-dependent oxidoreductase [Candidatus Saccharimonadales bacterium]|jgi:predicted Rossmann fold flavoprotein|nr:NAD(P)/FAD-dependent oxidoreductase [Candidatus Saccharimonadales bacterium]
MDDNTEKFDAIILGGGAAGLMCAMEAGKRGRRVIVLERAEKVGKKVLISGGGRCNFTNLHCAPQNFLSSNPHFAKSALARYTPADFIALVEKHGITYHEKTLGQLFCDRSAQSIVAMLEKECSQAGVRILVNTAVQEVQRLGDHGFTVRTAAATDAGGHADSEFKSAALVVATGGLSIPKMGATGFGYDLARQFGLAVRECRPALVPLVLAPEDRRRYCDLAGISAEVVAAIGPQSFREKMLITHRGLSGPAILQISSYWKAQSPVALDLAPDLDISAPLRAGNARRDLASAKAALRVALSQRFADRWLDEHPPQRWNNPALEELERRIHRWEVVPEGTEGYDKAEVTAGGVDTDELLAKTMESRKVPGLYFIGEVVDVTGQLGGFNFQWAWASGFCAGQGL